MNENPQEKRIKMKKLFGVPLVMAIVCLTLFLSGCTVVDPGEEGVRVTMGKAGNEVLSSGPHFVMPGFSHVTTFNLQNQKVDDTLLCYSQDKQTITLAATLNYRLKEKNAVWFLQEQGTEKVIFDKLVRQPFLEIPKQLISLYTLDHLLANREAISDKIESLVRERLVISNIEVIDFSITNIDLDDEYENAVKEKQVAAEKALKAKNDLDRVKVEGEQKIVQAKAEAETIRVAAEAITSQGGEAYVRLKAIEKWKGDVPTYMVPGSSVPFIGSVTPTK